MPAATAARDENGKMAEPLNLELGKLASSYGNNSQMENGFIVLGAVLWFMKLFNTQYLSAF